MSRILLIEDDPCLGPSLVDFLSQERFLPSLLNDPLNFSLDLLEDYDLLVLDLILPHLPGEEILRLVKEKKPAFPILVLTAKGRIENKKECFELGADDYLVKPFDILELSLRIKALLRRTLEKKRIVHIGDVQIDLERSLIKKDGKTINLSRRAWDLLCYFIENRGKVLSKEEILGNVWKDVLVTEESVRSYVKELRKILPHNSIETIKGRGYRLCEE